MKPTTDDLIEDDPRLIQAAREYLADLEAGRAPNRAAYLARYPDLASALTECFDSIDFAHRGAQAIYPTVPAPQTGYPANPLGDFQIIREIGRGGMGIVYEAVQLSLGRRVALKVLPFAAALEDKHLQRFKTEAHAAAQLHHTNIVPVYYVGHERGVHFYAMQLIEGKPLDAVIGELRDDGQTSNVDSSAATQEFRASPTVTSKSSVRSSQHTQRDRESFRTAARICEQVADALEYAHDAGVIHRDIKPANLLLDAKGTVWITDFGLAQVSADVSLTQTGNLLGTLRYMSPEQASGNRVLVDQRTDVYSLGATLYELLTLEPLFPGPDRQSLLHQILNDEPRPLRQVNRSIPVELETIALKALSKAPGDRYATAGEMAADLRRYLDERPILARRPSMLDRAHKWIRRHPALVKTTGLFLILGFFGLAASTLLVARAYDRERQRAKEAEERFELARKVADEMIRIAEEELNDNPFFEGPRKRMLEAALAYYQKFIEQRRDDPDAQAELAITRDRVKRIIDDLALLQGDRNIFLLREAAVLDDLRATDAQREQLAGLNRNLDERREDPFREFHRLSADERHQRFLDRARANEAAVSAILRPEQVVRLRQIALQFRGPAAFRESEIATALQLSLDQRDRMRMIEQESFLGGPPSRPPGGPPRDDFRKLMVQRSKDSYDKCLDLLTPEQSRRWQEMTGEPFKGSFESFKGPFRPMPGPPGGFGPQRP